MFCNLCLCGKFISYSLLCDRRYTPSSDQTSSLCALFCFCLYRNAIPTNTLRFELFSRALNGYSCCFQKIQVHFASWLRKKVAWTSILSQVYLLIAAFSENCAYIVDHCTFHFLFILVCFGVYDDEFVSSTPIKRNGVFNDQLLEALYVCTRRTLHLALQSIQIIRSMKGSSSALLFSTNRTLTYFCSAVVIFKSYCFPESIETDMGP